jgi:hypothetical protein
VCAAGTVVEVVVVVETGVVVVVESDGAEGDVVEVVVEDVVELELDVDVDVDVDVGTDVVVDDELVVVVAGPAGPALVAGAKPRRAARRDGSLPSMPRAQIPTPPKFFESASCAASKSDVASSKNVSCHWVPTWYEVHAVLVTVSQ